MTFPLSEEESQNSVSLKIEIWNENNMVDDLIGSTDIVLAEHQLQPKGNTTNPPVTINITNMHTALLLHELFFCR